MTRRVWRHRAGRNGEHKFTVDDDQDVLMQFSTRVIHPDALAQRLLEVIAAHHGDQIENTGVGAVDWAGLGWPGGRAEHDAMVGDLRVRTIALNPAERAWVVAERERAGIDNHGPFTADDTLMIDSLITRAPVVVAQDAAAEEVSAA